LQLMAVFPIVPVCQRRGEDGRCFLKSLHRMRSDRAFRKARSHAPLQRVIPRIQPDSLTPMPQSRFVSRGFFGFLCRRRKSLNPFRTTLSTGEPYCFKATMRTNQRAFAP
jgi:hypothetical protein